MKKMEKGRRSGGDSSEYVVKNRSSSGCLVVRKKGGGDGVGPLGFDSREKNKKRRRVEFGESGSSDEILTPSRRRLGPETIRVCNGLSGLGKGSDGSGGFGREGGEDFGDSKQNRLDIFEFDEYDGNDVGVVRRKGMGDGGVDGRKFHGSVTVGRGYESGSGGRGVEDRRKSLERTGGMSRGDGSRHPIALLRDKHDSDEPIRVQGKNGVLKVMVNKKKKTGSGESLNMFGLSEATEDRRGARTEGFTKRNDLIRPPPYSESKHVEKVSSFSGTLRSPSSVSKSTSSKNGKISRRNSERKNVQVKLSDVEAHKSLMKSELNKSAKGRDMDSEDSETSLKRGKKKVDSCSTVKGISEGGEKLPSNQPLPIKAKEGKVKRGSGTEKQKLRERIRQMLLDSGWTIDYRPRKNRDYLDAVYINPNGTAYWSIIKAYEALLKQINVEEDEVKSGDDGSPFAPLPDELLSQLTRKTKKKIENEMKRKKRNDSNDGNVRANSLRRSASSKHDEESMDSGSSHEEKLSSFIKLGGKSSKSKMNSNGSAIVNSKGQSSAHHLPDSLEKASSGSHSQPGRKSRKLGRCTLLVRNSTDGLDSETDGFIPYSGKRTLLSWLIDCGFVQLSQKVLYMNRRRTKVMLEGWVTRDGIHCGCCSKILTVSRFEIHAGSKLRQPFQNICLESGVSLLECQVDAWNQRESIEHIGFHTVDTDGDDPNDDTCGLCGDGGDLICCDGCPSTFHQSCLDIEMLPPGDWHCPNCTCKFCGVAGEKLLQGGAISISSLLTCSLCSKKYHTSCIIENDDSPVDCDAADPCFCGRKCRELFEQLQKHLGVKHELEAGFSWSLIHRTDANLETTIVGLPQKVECNAKLAIALSVMDECFLPIIDRRSGINLVHNVIYNCGSNFNRLNYGGFYAAILERGDELIAAASLRFHGTRLVEMPFIGTRHIYRRQGMCRRLFSAIESALCSFKVEQLIIPAVSELTHTWTEVFGFTTIDKSLKQELKCLNMLVFPGVDMLQKQLFVPERTEGSQNFSTDGAEVVELQNRLSVTSKAATKPDIEYLARPETGGDNHTEVVTMRPDAECSHVPANDASLISGPVDATHEEKGARFLKDAKDTHTESDDKLIESVEDIGHCLSDSSQDVKRLDGKTKLPSLFMGNDQSQIIAEEPVTGGSLDASRKHGNPVSLKQRLSVNPQPGGEIGKSEYGQTCKVEIMRGLGQNEIKQELVCPIVDHCQSSKLDIDVTDASNMANSISDGTDSSVTIREVKPTDPPVVHRSSEVVLQEEFLFNHDTDLSAAEKKPDLMFVSGNKGHTQPDGECDIGDAELVNAGSSPEAPYLPDEVVAESSLKNVDETAGVTVSRLRDADDTAVEVASEPDNKCV